MEQIIITKESCGGCPMVWDCILPDGSEGYIRYRWGVIQLKKITDRPGLLQGAIIFEQIGDDLDGVLSLDAAKIWLQNNGYNVIDVTNLT